MNRLVLTFPDAPSLNKMIDLAKKRARVGKRMLPIVYNTRKQAYEDEALIRLRQQGHAPPRTPWQRWRIDAVEIRRHNLLDPLEALSCAKWPLDSLVKGRYVADDSPRHLIYVPMPTQMEAE